MDPLDRADALLNRAQARGAYVVTPQSAISPMDAANTQQIPREVVRGADAAAVDPDATTIVTEDEILQHDSAHHLEEAAPTTSLDQDQPDNSGETTQSLNLTPTGEIAPRVEPEPAEGETEVEEEELDGLIPTTTQRMKLSSKVSRRLEG